MNTKIARITEHYDQNEGLKIRDSNRLHDLTEKHRALKAQQTKCVIGRGLIYLEVVDSGIWLAQGYSSVWQCFADPKGFNVQPRTARFYAKIARAWLERLAVLDVTEKEVCELGETKLALVVRKIDEGLDDEELLKFIHDAKTRTVRDLIEDKEGDDYYIFDGKAKVHKWLNDSSGYIIHLSQGKCKFYEESPSAQGWNNVFGQRLVEIKIRLKKDGEEKE